MHILANKNIILGISGGIAAYKSADLVRRLQDTGCTVQVVMTPAAEEFITPLTLQALSGRSVRTSLFDPAAEAAMGHIELARWADVILLAPATANTIAKLAHGSADDLLSTLCLATDAPIALAPAMNRLMWANAATQSNIEQIRQRGLHIFGPGSGEQACGETGEGRMLEPEQLVSELESMFAGQQFAGKHLLITAGPTREAIDPVRFISNHSSGKMGYALAQAAIQMGARVTLVSGPVQLPVPKNAECIKVETALDMHAAVLSRVESVDIFIACAAVADYRLDVPAQHKLKKNTDEVNLNLVKNPDILADVAALPNSPFTLGFAAETNDLHDNALLKLKRKGLNMIAANWVQHESDQMVGFNSDDNALEVFWQAGHQSLSKTSKPKLARQLLELAATLYEEQKDKSKQHPNHEKTTS